MSDNKEKDTLRPMDVEEMTAEEEALVSGGMEDVPAYLNMTQFNIAYYNSAMVNMPYLK